MFALNKENLVLQAPQHGGKPTNANLKTPGPQNLHPKTPFKLPAGGDENGAAATANPKTGKMPGIMAHQFITPAPGPRQVLGRKTTNAKARNLAPAEGDLGKTLKKTPGSSLRPLKSKITVAHDPESAIHEEEDIPEIEYIPPRSKEPPLVPDILEPIDYDFISQNLMRGCYRSYLSGLDDNGKTRTQRLLEESERIENEALDREAAALLSELQNGIPPLSRPIKPAPTSTKPASSRLAQKPSSTTSSTIRRLPREPIRPASTTSTSRPTSRPTSRASTHSSRQRSSSRPRSRNGPSTLDSRKTASLLPQPSAPITSAVRPSSRSASHVRSSSAHRRPTSSGSGATRAPSSGRSASNVVSRNTAVYIRGRDIAPKVREVLQVESSTEMIHRILLEDREAEESGTAAVVPDALLEEDAEREEREEEERMRRLLDGIVVIEEEEDDGDFVLRLPGLEEELML